MAQPRRIVPGASYLVTRRVSQRAFRLRPDPLTNQIARYCLAWAAEKAGVLVHSVVLMSNHEQTVITDMHGRLPEFLRELHRPMAKAINAAQGQSENLWSAEPTSVVLLPTLHDVLHEIAYVAANPVAAGLVEHPEQWPGVVHWEPGESVVAQRPPVYFDPFGSAPETLELRIAAPPSVRGEEEHWAHQVRRAVAEMVSEAQTAVRRRGSAFIGAAAALGESIWQRARSKEEKPRSKPTVAAKDPSVRKTFLNTLRQFQRAYRVALLAWKGGDRGVDFPFGTWWMRVHHGADMVPALE